ncbi:MAG: transcription termination factor NusA [Desulfovibrio sp.]|jgi:N utilization substance protein A|nr:transcription termination factor NusA [Desulfovibrio sp.]
MGLELKKAIDQISKDKGLDRAMLVETLEEAVRTSVQRKFGEDVDVEVSFNEETGEIDVFQYKIVVEQVEDESIQVSLEEARKHDPGIRLDDEVGFRLKVEDLGRIAAQSAKQVIIQRMRDAEQGIIYDEYKDRINEIASGIVQRRDKAGWIINLGRTEALLPKEEQIPREHYKRGDRVQALIIEVRKEGRGPQVIVSRSHRDYMAALFKREVPEVDDGIVQIMGVARDPGSRAKVAVLSRERDVDPVGACVGVRGSRIQNIVQELRSERIDIVVWSPDIAAYARNALSPAVISRIVVDEAEGLLEVIVPDDQLTNSIGRKGQNVKLAAKLLGWKIDIYTETRYNEANAIGKGLEQLAAVVEVPAENFAVAGLVSFEAVSLASDEEILAVTGMTEKKLANLRAAVNFLRPSGEKGDTAAAGAEDADDTGTADETDDAAGAEDAGDAGTAGEADDDGATDAEDAAGAEDAGDAGTAGEADDDGATDAEDAPATDKPAETNDAD